MILMSSCCSSRIQGVFASTTSANYPFNWKIWGFSTHRKILSKIKISMPFICFQKLPLSSSRWIVDIRTIKHYLLLKSFLHFNVKTPQEMFDSKEKRKVNNILLSKIFTYRFFVFMFSGLLVPFNILLKKVLCRWDFIK